MNTKVRTTTVGHMTRIDRAITWPGSSGSSTVEIFLPRTMARRGVLSQLFPALVRSAATPSGTAATSARVSGKEANGRERRGGQEAARTVVPLQEKTVRPEPVNDGVSARVSFQLRPPSAVQSCRCSQWQADPDVTLITPRVAESRSARCAYVG